MDDHRIGIVSNIGVISFVALSAYLLLLTGEISFGQQAFFAIGAYTSGIVTAMWQLPFALGARLRALRRERPPPCWSGCRRCGFMGLQFAIATLAFAEAVRISCSNCSAIKSYARRRTGRTKRHRGFP